MRVNQTRERLAKGETAFGCALQVYRSAEIPRAFAAAGFDYVFIDMEVPLNTLVRTKYRYRHTLLSTLLS